MKVHSQFKVEYQVKDETELSGVVRLVEGGVAILAFQFLPDSQSPLLAPCKGAFDHINRVTIYKLMDTMGNLASFHFGNNDIYLPL